MPAVGTMAAPNCALELPMRPLPAPAPTLSPVRPAGPAQRPQHLGSVPAPGRDAQAAAYHGCGWYDSSHDLHCGLRVTEHSDLSALAHQLPAAWIRRWDGRS